MKALYAYLCDLCVLCGYIVVAFLFFRVLE